MNEINDEVSFSRENIESILIEALVNSGEYKNSPEQEKLTSQFATLILHFLKGTEDKSDAISHAIQFANQGVSFGLVNQLFASISSFFLSNGDETAVFTLPSFQISFLEHFAEARASIAKNTQNTLKNTIKEQEENQRQSHTMQTKRTHALNQILQLNAQLAAANNEQKLLEEAVVGLCQALELMDVSVYQFIQPGDSWSLRATSVEQLRNLFSTTEFTHTLDAAVETGNDIIQYLPGEDKKSYLSISTLLKSGTQLLGAMILRADQLDMHGEDSLLIMTRTFAQNLAAQWNNLLLLEETNRRSSELEVLYGRFVDELWREESVGLQAKLNNGKLEIDQTIGKQRLSQNKKTIPLEISDFTFGHVQLPEGLKITADDQNFVETIVREMGDALNNAYLLQTTRSFSNQLEVAAEVSRAASTILDQTQLIEAVVNLIQERFGFYYVGLFVVNQHSQLAELKAGTGKAGQIQLSRKHALPLDDSSMVGAAITSREAFVEQDVTRARAFMKNPVLPDTQSELALPLRTHDQTIGALTVQSVDRGAFSQTAVTVLQSLADQLAIAIENASLFAQTQQNLSEANRLYEAGRNISAATDAFTIYQILVDFAAESGLFDIVQAYIEDPKDSDYLLRIAEWNRVGIENKKDEDSRLQRDTYRASRLLERKQAQWFEDDFSSLDAASKSLLDSYHVNGGIFIPLHNEDEWLGTLILACSHTPTPSKQAIQPYRTLARQAAIILANHQLLLQTEVLYRIGRAITQTITRDDALQIAVREVGKYIGSSQCRFVLYDQQEGVGHIVASYNPSGITDSITLPMLGDNVFNFLNNKKEPMLLEENGANVSRECIQQHVLQFGAKASMLIPSASQQELIGFLAIDSVRGKRPFKSSNIIFAQTVIDHLTTQIENIKLLDEALSRAQELITLNQIQSNISGVLDINSLATAVYDQIGRLLDNTIFNLALYEAKSNKYTPIFSVYNGQVIELAPRDLSIDEPLYQFLQEPSPTNTSGQSPLLLAEATHLPQPTPKSALWIPLVQEETTIGLLSVQSFESTAYAEQDIQLLRSIATQTSLAIANAQLFETIQANNEKLRQLDNLKNQFLANMSHELRTPLNSIIGFSRVILKGIDGPITNEQEEDLTSIYHNGQHLLTLINEILDMAKIEAGKMALSIVPVDIVETAKAASKTITGLIQEGNIQFIWDVPSQLPTIEADQVRMRQVFINLLSNAIKYTQAGKVTLSIREKENELQISVKDTGIGIASEDFSKIFAAFEQVDNSTTRTAGGTGLGLPITKWIVEMHNGRIWFESIINHGSTFYVTLPLTQKRNFQVEEQKLS